MNSDLEIWKPIPFNALYEVSTFGNFRNAKTKKQKSFDIEKLKQTKTRIRVEVKNTIKPGSGFYLHRLMAITFIPNPENLEEVNHKDGNPYNNCVANLEWITREDNMKHFHENRVKYENKNLRQVIMCCRKTDAILASFKCVEDCIATLGLNISYTTLYVVLKGSSSVNTKGPVVKYANKYVGVSYNANKKYNVIYRNKYMGCFKEEIDAAKEYDSVIRRLGITPVVVNFPGPGEIQAIVGKKKYSEVLDGKYILDNKYLKFADELIRQPVDETLIWRQIEEAPNYEISNTGLVKHSRLNRVLGGYNINGYVSVALKQDGVQLARLVHRLVAASFIPNDDPVNRIYVDHIDTNPHNNCVSNLRWVTPKENSNNELTKKNMSAGHMRGSPKVYQVEMQTGNIIRCVDNAKEMETQTGVKCATIQKIANYYKKIAKDGQKSITNDGKWIFLYKNECECRMQFITNNHKIIQIDKKTGLAIATYDSMTEASQKLNINYSGISQVCNYYKYDDQSRPSCYKLKTTHGFIFKEITQDKLDKCLSSSMDI